MEGKKEVGVGGSNSCSSSSPPSSFTSELFGSKDSASSSSSGIFNSIFASSNKPYTGQSLRSEVVDKKQEFGTKPAAPDTMFRDKEGERKSPPKKENNSYYQEQRVQPCHLSSSIYYGGQDVYHSPKSSTQNSGYPTYNKDGGEDDGCASRGNWWQGSLYY